jgi:hypothetical protein
MSQAPPTTNDVIKYGSVTVDWNGFLKARRPKAGQLKYGGPDFVPKGVHVRYFVENFGRRVVTLAYIYDKDTQCAYFRACHYRQDEPWRDGKSLSFSKPSHRFTACDRLLKEPHVMFVPLPTLNKTFTGEDGITHNTVVPNWRRLEKMLRCKLATFAKVKVPPPLAKDAEAPRVNIIVCECSENPPEVMSQEDGAFYCGAGGAESAC